jgi:hypothetical protein
MQKRMLHRNMAMSIMADKLMSAFRSPPAARLSAQLFPRNGRPAFAFGGLSTPAGPAPRVRHFFHHLRVPPPDQPARLALARAAFSAFVRVKPDATTRNGRRNLGVACRRFEQLDGIATGILHKDLLSSEPDDNVIAEPSASASETFHGLRQIIDLDLNAVPTTWCRKLTVRHGAPPATSSGLAQQEAQISS